MADGTTTGNPSSITISITDAQGIPRSAMLTLEGRTLSQLTAVSHIIPKALELMREIKKVSPGGK